MLERVPKQFLEGEKVRLELLSHCHRQSLIEAIKDGKLWQITETMVPNEEEVADFIDKAQIEHADNTALVYAIVDKESNIVVGSSRLMNINSAHKKVEVGYTFIAASWQKTYVNTETKLLLLTLAFESMKVHRVEFSTDSKNFASQKAIERIGATREGTLRNHMILRNERTRHSIIYSIITDEWNQVKMRLQDYLKTKMP
ncbi:GNAT family protein [uncultured Shewanella sp.]|uniref:GNAT family N-acetyltransferase n=1 Tax=uncultured Shewanella sp. TaxID=173975 RepID=UPI00261D5FFA|nr:GNAT family protein [uncultured Shewanella sp.]